MSVNNIKDIKNVDSENFDYLLAESNFRIESVFRQRNKRVVEPNVPITTDLVADSITTIADYTNHYLPKNDKTKTGGTFDFLMPANEYGLMDLRDGEIVVQAQFSYMDQANTNNEEGIANAPRFGNQCLMSLFQQIQLFIDDTEIQCNKWPGFSSNAEFALRYPHCKTLEEDYEIHGYNRTDEECYKLCPYISKVNPAKSIEEVEKSFKNQGITLKIVRIAPAAGHPGSYIYTGFINQRIKLSDVFSVIDTLPPLYNHSVLIRFNRTPNNDIICNTATVQGVKCQFLGFQKFKIYQDVYVTTDQFIQTAKKYYSKPIETLITQDKQYFQPIISQPNGNDSQEFNINIDAAYKNKLLTLAIPRSTNFAYQGNMVGMHYMKPDWATDAQLSKLTNLKDKPIVTLNFDGTLAGITAADVTSLDELHFIQTDNTESGIHYDTTKAPANSYTYGGLRSLEVVNASAGTKLYNFEMENDGVIKGNSTILPVESAKTQYNYRNAANDVRLANYEDVYRQYVKARLHFQQSEEEALDFNTFMKEYCIFCVDLSPFDISPGDQIKVTMVFSDWSADYNPYFSYNAKTEIAGVYGANIPARYSSSNIICNLFCDKVLRLLPGRQIQLADMISTSTVEVENSTMA
jgi:hypothetical protein